MDLDILDSEKLSIVNGFTVNEISFDLGTVEFHDAMDGNMQLGIWYSSNNLPIIAEFDIDVRAKDPNDSNNIDEFPASKVGKIDDFYKTMQTEKSIVDLEISKTKTQYAYDCGRT